MAGPAVCTRVGGHNGREDAVVQEQASAEARRAARGAAPLLLLALLLLRYVLGDSAATHAVRVALVVQLGAIALRWGTLAFLSPERGRELRPRSWHGPAVTATAWATSAGVANILLRAEYASSVQLLELTLVCTAVCAIAQRSMAPHPISYGGYVLIQFSALLVLVLRSPDRSLIPVMPVMFAIFLVALGVSVVRSNKDVRERIRLAMELHDSSLRDALTGLRNRRFAVAFAEQRAAQVIAAAAPGRRAAARTPQLAFLLVDLDHFKSINDRYGHAAGDAVLAAFAAIATKTFRAHDVIARWGGEEFLITLEVPEQADAAAAAERLRSALAQAPIEIEAGVAVRVTCSIGVSLLPCNLAAPAAASWQDTIRRADSNLYRAKADGRNRVCTDRSADDTLESASRVLAVADL